MSQPTTTDNTSRNNSKASISGEQAEKGVRIAVTGAQGAGKSSITTQFTNGVFNENSFNDPTIEDIFRKKINLDNQTYILDIIDTAGLEAMNAPAWPRTEQVFIILYSITDYDSLIQAEHITYDIQNYRDGLPFPFVLVGNKTDLSSGRQVTAAQAETFAVRIATRLGVSNSHFACRETSAKSDPVGCDDVFHTAVHLSERFKIDTKPTPQQSWWCSLV